MAQIMIVKLVRNGWPADEAPEMIEEDLLAYSTGLLDNENEHTIWEEWRLDGLIVKRGAHVTLKQRGVSAGAFAARIG
jgi:hypothetical protein